MSSDETDDNISGPTFAEVRLNLASNTAEEVPSSSSSTSGGETDDRSNSTGRTPTSQSSPFQIDIVAAPIRQRKTSISSSVSSIDLSALLEELQQRDEEKEQVSSCPSKKLYGRRLQQGQLLRAFQKSRRKPKPDQAVADEVVSTSSSLSSGASTTFLDIISQRENDGSSNVNVGSSNVRSKSLGEMVLISGPSGSGKTALADALRPAVAQAKGFFLSGKYDQLDAARPERRNYPIVQAFTEFARLLSLETSDNDDKEADPYWSHLKASVSACGETNRLVFDMIPALESTFGFESTALTEGTEGLKNEVHGAQVEKRLEFAFCQFVKAVASPQRPIVLMLDDLQWADPASLDLLTALLSDTCVNGLMVLGVCRDNEMTMAHQLTVMLRELEASDVGIRNIQVGDLCSEDVSDMVSDILKITEEDRIEMGQFFQFVYEETHGNIFFVLQLLRTLAEESLLYKQDGKVRWESESVIKATLDLSNPGKLVSWRLGRMADDVQEVLRIASCFGTGFNDSHLQMILKRNVTPELDMAKQKGFVLYDAESESWRFAHDQIEAACYRMIPEAEIDHLHLTIGRILWAELGPDLDDEGFLVVVNQLRLGAHLLQDQGERDRMATLLLEAAKKASQSATFKTAASHLRLAISLLGKRHWRDQYGLSLELYLMAAEVEYCIGKLERMDELLNEVLENARTTIDRVKASTMSMYALSTRNDLPGAVELGLATLRQLGVRFPSKGRVHRILIEFLRTKWMLRKFSDNDILGLPVMREQQHLASMRIMILVFTDALISGSMLAPLLCMRMMQETLKHGITGMSSAVLAYFALFLFKGFGEIELGVRLANLSHQLLERFQTREWLPRTYVMTYGFVYSSTMPFRDIVKPLLVAHRVGLVTGDLEFAFHAANGSTVLSLCAGRHLAEVNADVSIFVGLMRTHSQTHTLDLTLPCVQVILNLMGRSEDPLQLKGDALDFDKAMDAAVASKNDTFVAVLLWSKLLLLTYMGDFSGAKCVGEMLAAVNTDTFTSHLEATWFFFRGLAILASGRPSRRGIRIVKFYIRRLKALAKHCRENYQNKVDFLEAELASCQRKYDLALEKFAACISLSQSEANYGELGLAYERAAVTLEKVDRRVDAAFYVENAIQAYDDWGADGKVALLRSIVTASAPSV